MSGSAAGSEYNGDDFYCDVAIPHVAALQVEHNDEWVLAFHHTRPFWNTHIVVAPRRHVRSLTTVSEGDADLMRRMFVVVQDIARKVEHRHGAASVVTNLGRYQDSKHFHVHVHSGERRRN
jgi:histidine triad (HIT) family protein